MESWGRGGWGDGKMFVVQAGRPELGFPSTHIKAGHGGSRLQGLSTGEQRQVNPGGLLASHPR